MANVRIDPEGLQYRHLEPGELPDEQSNWKKNTIKLTQEGKAFTKHKEEIPADTVNNVYMLLTNTQLALENRLNDNYVENYLSKITTRLHDKLHCVMMLGACFLVVFFKVRGGQEEPDDPKLVKFKLNKGETLTLTDIAI